MADQRVGIAYQAVDGPAHGAVRLLHKLHIQLGQILDKMRHADLEGTGGVGDPDPGLAGMGLRVGLELLKGLEGRILVRYEQNRQQGRTPHGPEILGRGGRADHVGLQDHRAHRREIHGVAVGLAAERRLRRLAHHAIFKDKGHTQNLRHFRIVDLAQRVIRRGLEGMIHGYGVFRILREGHLGHGDAEPEQGNAK